MNNKKEIFLIPYAHLDTQWRWEFPTTIRKYIKATIDDNIHLFEKYPDYHFNFTGAIRFSMMKEYYPEQYKKVKKYIEENRWHFAGTCLDETDPLSPSVESMIRNILYGDRWAKMEFGKSSRDYLIPDCFGFPANMPSVLTHCGIHGFSTQKLTWGSAVGIPFEIGIWKGPDGSELVSSLNPGSYTSRLHKPLQSDNERLERMNALGNKNGIWKCFQYYGTGDIGGAPAEGSVQHAITSIQQSVKENSDLVVKQGSPDQFFSEITEQEKQQMDRYSGDFLLVNHSAGSITSAAIMKRWNRLNEQLAFAAEVAAIMAREFTGIYPDQKIKSAWYRTIGNQMHDILPGTCTPLAYEYSQNDEVVALNTWSTILQDSAAAIAPFVKGKGNILLFNPLGEPRKDIVDIELLDWDEKNNSRAIIVDSDGKSLPVQIRKNEAGTFQATFVPDLKPCSWARFSLSILETGDMDKISDPVSLTTQDSQYVLENATYRVSVSKDGTIYSIFQKKIQKELLKKPLAYEFQKERPLFYPAWNMDWSNRKKPPFLRIEGGASVSILETGPLRCTLQITTQYKASKFVKEISLSSISEIVEFVERINWRGKGCSLKLALNSNMAKPNVTYNWETSRIQRGINNEKLFEMPSRYWVDIGEQNWGISLIEDSKYGYDHPHEDTLRMTLLYTPGVRYVTGFLDQKWQDWGEHTIRYGLYGHEGNLAGTDRIARRFNQRVRLFSINHDLSSVEKKHCSLFDISSDELGILAIKKPEEGEGILIRVYERYGKTGHADLTFNSVIQRVTEVNGLEEPIKDISFSGTKFSVKLEANQIHSYIVILATNQNPINIKQEALKLNFNSKLIGRNGDQQSLFPSEMIPQSIHAGEISYQLAPDEVLNTIKCQGQKISIPPNYNTLSILVGSMDACDSIFQWIDHEGIVINEVKRSISALTGFQGQWDKRKWLRKPTHYLKDKRDYAWINMCVGVEPGFLNRDRLEWYSTHTHKNGEDQAYQYGHMYTINLEIPEKAESLILPKDERVCIFAITASKQIIDVKSSQLLRDKFDF